MRTKPFTCITCGTVGEQKVEGRDRYWCGGCNPRSAGGKCIDCGEPSHWKGARCAACKAAEKKARGRLRTKKITEAKRAARIAAGKVTARELSPEEAQAKRRAARLAEYIRRHGRVPRPMAEIRAELAATADQRREARLAKDRARERAARQAKSIAKGCPPREPKPWNGLPEAEKYRMRYALDPEFNLRERLRAASRKGKMGYRIASRVRDGVSRRKGRGTGKIEQFLGYTFADLRRHLERQFTPEMTWDRFLRAEIVIDHITPLKMFDLSIEAEVLAAWALPNLRPLDKDANAKKGAKRLFLL